MTIQAHQPLPTLPTTMAECRMRHLRLRGPAWRSQLARGLAAFQEGFQIERGDLELRRMTDYFRLLNQGDMDLATHRYGEIHGAIALQANPRHAHLLRMQLMGGMSPWAVAEQVGSDLEPMQMWEDLFFDVRGIEMASRWTSTFIFGPLEADGYTMEALQLKMAFLGRHHATQALIAAEESSAAAWPIKEVERVYAEQVAQHSHMVRLLARAARYDQEEAVDFMCSYRSQLQSQRSARKHTSLLLAKQVVVSAQAEAESLARLATAQANLARRQANRAAKEAAKQQRADARQKQQMEREANRAAQQETNELYAQVAAHELAERIASSPLNQLRWDLPATGSPERPIGLADLDRGTGPEPSLGCSPVLADSNHPPTSGARHHRGAA